MPESVIYDDAVYHQGAPVFVTRKLDPRNAGTHIGMYVAWIIQQRLESFQLRQNAAEPVEAVRSKQMPGRDFLFAHLGGRLTSDALNNEAREFTAQYYEAEYLSDYDEVLVDGRSGSYAVVDSWANFERLCVVMNRRLSDFRGLNARAGQSRAARASR